jgi:hypothetical protein
MSLTTSKALRPLTPATALLAVSMLLGLLRCTAAQPANDNFRSSIDLTASSALFPLGSSFVTSVDNLLATVEENEPEGPLGALHHTVWWSVLIPAGAVSLTVGCMAHASTPRRLGPPMSTHSPSHTLHQRRPRLRVSAAMLLCFARRVRVCLAKCLWYSDTLALFPAGRHAARPVGHRAAGVHRRRPDCANANWLQ